MKTTLKYKEGDKFTCNELNKIENKLPISDSGKFLHDVVITIEWKNVKIIYERANKL